MAMADPDPHDAPDAAAAKVGEEWRRLEEARVAEEIAEAREDAGTAAPRLPGWTWLALAAALAAGILAAAWVNGVFGGAR